MSMQPRIVVNNTENTKNLTFLNNFHISKITEPFLNNLQIWPSKLMCEWVDTQRLFSVHPSNYDSIFQ